MEHKYAKISFFEDLAEKSQKSEVQFSESAPQISPGTGLKTKKPRYVFCLAVIIQME